MDEHYARLKKLLTEGHMVQDFIYVNAPNRQIYREEKWISGF